MKMAFHHVAVIKLHHLLFIFCLWLQAALLIAISSASYDISKPECVNKCGDISIPYPFGIGDANCFLNTYKFFNITCNATSFNPPKPFFGGFEVLDINLHGQMRVNTFVASDCYTKNGRRTSSLFSITGGNSGAFSLSETRNKLVAIGCDTVAYISGPNYKSGCLSSCDSIEYVINGSCTGRGCCQTSIPAGLTNFLVDLTSFDNHTKIWDFNPCSYAFLVEENWFNFSSLNLKDYQNSEVPVVIDWAVGILEIETCTEAKKNSTGTEETKYGEAYFINGVPEYNALSHYSLVAYREF